MAGETLHEPFSPRRLARIAAQIERLQSREAEWTAAGDEVSPVRIQVSEPAPPMRKTGSIPSWTLDFGCAWRGFLVILKTWEAELRRLVREMEEQVRQPFSVRTLQISVFCAFVPFVIAILTAGVRFTPQLPALSFWSKVTWFIMFPIFLAMAGALVGFLFGVMLDSLERQVREKEIVRNPPESAGTESVPVQPAHGIRTGVWVAVEDLEPNCRVAETVTGSDGTPLLLRHTLLQPAHIEMLKNQGIEKVKVEVMKYPSGGEKAVA